MTLLRLALVGACALVPLLFVVRRRFALAYARALVLVVACVIVLAPFLWLVAAAFKDPRVLNEYVFFPPPSAWSRETLNLTNFRELFAPRATPEGPIAFGRFVLNSLFVATVSTVLQLVCCSLGGFALAKYGFRGKRALMGFMLASMTIPGLLLLAPLYEMMVHFGLVDTYWALLLPAAVSSYGVLLFRQAILEVPDELLDAARLDGCSELGLYFRIVMPLVRPMSAAFCLFSALGSWNSYLGPNIFLHSQRKLTLPVVLNMYVTEYSSQYGVYLAGTLLAVAFPLILFLALQREFISGLSAGAVKG